MMIVAVCVRVCVCVVRRGELRLPKVVVVTTAPPRTGVVDDDGCWAVDEASACVDDEVADDEEMTPLVACSGAV